MKPAFCKYGTIVIIVLLIFLTNADAIASDKGSFQIEKCSRIQAGASLGGKTSNDYNFSNTGFTIQHTYVIKPTTRYGLGVGAGIHTTQGKNYVPIYLDFIGFMSDNRPYFINMQTGYSIGWKKSPTSFEGDFKGGPLINAGIGRRFKFQSGFSGFLQIEYRHQFSSIVHDNIDTPSYKENLNLDFIVISVGIMLEQK